MVSTDPFESLRQRMIAVIAAQAVFSAGETTKPTIAPRVLEAMARVPRHEFVPAEVRPHAYADTPLPIGCDKTISQPFICALMTDLLDPGPHDTVLEIGTGLGYHAALLCGLAKMVYSIEIIEELAQQAKERLVHCGCTNIKLRLGNGFYGWSDAAPFDRILVTAAADLVPAPLLRQLKPGGKMVIPTGLPDAQRLVLVEKEAGGKTTMKELLRVRFALLEGAE